ncbi:MAG TPA: tRNA pseudouridine(38-40) synthase TruA [Bacteroidales bacterium]|nr:tRNA pseudouridine(38-40) synthase TruA [Bacteroidales bacterium]
MGRFKLNLEYEGTRYTGWQIQKGGKTIQGEITDACRNLFGTSEFELFGAGRTDSGVHARGQVAHLDVETELPLLRIKYGINDRLPPDISILSVEEAGPKFHARHDAVARSYIYQISRRRTAFGKKFVWWIKDELDLKKMKEAATHFTGLRDFVSFTDPDQEQSSTKVKILHSELHEFGDMILFHVIGSHFLWKQIRRMTGILVETGRGNIDPAEMENFFTVPTNLPAKFTAPPSGLFLDRVYYKDDDFDKDVNPVIYI